MDKSADLQLIKKGRFLNFVHRGGWEFVDRTNVCGIVCMAATTTAGELILIEQFRPPVGRDVIELPAGLAGDEAGTENEPLVEAARRELLEETGYRSHSITEVFRGVPSAGATSEELTMFVARDAERVGDGGGDAAENILVHVVPMNNVFGWLEQQRASGKAIDFKIYSGLYALQNAPIVGA